MTLLVAIVTGITACARDASEDRPDAQPPPFDPLDAGQEDVACRGTRCSLDLKRVLNECTDDVVEECQDGKGCGDGQCVDPCTSRALQGSVGCSFWTLPPDDNRWGVGSCFAAMIANTWDLPVTIKAELGTNPLDVSGATYVVDTTTADNVSYTLLDGALPAGKVAIVFLSLDAHRAGNTYFVDCPTGITAAFDDDPMTHGTGRTRAFRLTTDAPVSAYSIYPYGGARSAFPTATLLLPVSSWSESYVAVSAWADTAQGYPFLQIAADQDDTEVRLRASADISDGVDVEGVAEGATQTWNLSRGEVLQITQPKDISGSFIESTKAIGVFGGSQCTFVPAKASACDMTQQQISPLSQWGNEYALVPYRSRLGAGNFESVPYRLVAAVDGTKLSYDPVAPSGAPLTLDAGQTVTFMTNTLVVVKSQDASHPLYAGMFMTGSDYIVPGGIPSGDPDFVSIVPSDQFLDRYIFFADYTFRDTSLTIVRRKTKNGFAPVDLECAGEVADFQPLGTSGEYEYAWVELTRQWTPQTFTRGKCGYGRHEVSSDGPFSVTVWGDGFLRQLMAIRGGMGSRPINEVRIDVPK